MLVLCAKIILELLCYNVNGNKTVCYCGHLFMSVFVAVWCGLCTNKEHCYQYKILSRKDSFTAYAKFILIIVVVSSFVYHCYLKSTHEKKPNLDSIFEMEIPHH